MSIKWRIQKLEGKIQDDQAVYAGLVAQLGNPHLMGNSRTKIVTGTTLDFFGNQRREARSTRVVTYNSRNQHMRRDLEKLRKTIVTNMNTLRSMKILAGQGKATHHLRSV